MAAPRLAAAALLATAAATAFDAVPRAPGVARCAVITTSAARFHVQVRASMSWKEELEALLSPKTAAEDRGILARDLFARSAEIAGDVASAVSSGRPDDLLPEKLRKDLGSVQRQVEEDLLPQLPGMFERAPQTLQAAAAAAVSSRGPAAVASLLADPSRAMQLFASVSQDVDSLYTPSYKTLSSRDGYEIRQYASYAVASCDMVAADGDDLVVQMTTSSSAFSSLSAFIYGSNGREELLGMTTPVRIDVATAYGPVPSTMSFVLPTEYSAASAPAPTDEQVRLEQIPLQTLAVVDFTGFATDGEIARQREKLLSQLKADGVQLIVDSTTDAFSVFQYDPPYTLPWLRRNELAIPVVAPRMSPLGADAVEDGESEPPVSGEVVEDDETLEGDRAIAGAADDESDTENEL